MRRSAIGGLAMVLLMGLSVAAAPRDDDDDAPPKKSAASPSSWSFRHWLGLSDKSTAKKAPEKSAAKKTDAPAPKPVPSPTQAAKDAASERQREEKTLQRRQAVLLKLQEIALETNDTELERLTDQLNERVWSLYMQRIARLPASRATFESDERVLNKHLGADAGNGGPASSSLVPAAGDKGRGDRAAVVEDKR